MGCACAGNAGNIFPATWVSDPDMHHGTCVTPVPWCMPELLTNGSLWNRWQGKRSRDSRRMRNPHFFVSGTRPMADNASCLRCCQYRRDGPSQIAKPFGLMSNRYRSNACRSTSNQRRSERLCYPGYCLQWGQISAACGFQLSEY